MDFVLDSHVEILNHTGIDGGLLVYLNESTLWFSRDGTGTEIPRGTDVVLVVEARPITPAPTPVPTASPTTAPTPVPTASTTVPDEHKPKNKRDWIVIVAVMLTAMFIICCCFGMVLLCRRKKEPYDGTVLKFQIQGHTNVAADEVRQLATELSTQRAAAVENFLVDGGVDRRILNSRGFGFDQPLVRDGTSPDAHINLRVVVVLQNLYELERIIQEIEQHNADWKPEQGFGICGSPDVRINMKTGELVHPAIEFKDHTADLISECAPAVAAVARVLVYLELHARRNADQRRNLKNKTPVQQPDIEKELDRL